MSDFDLYLGIDYSGAQTPTSRLKNLQVYAAQAGGMPQKWSSPTRSNNAQPCNWTRAEIAQLLLEQSRQGERFLAGIDHGFSFPLAYFRRYGLASWPEFLADFVKHWPTDGDHVRVEDVRDGTQHARGGPAPGLRVGDASELRLCENWTSSAKSVFLFDVNGSVAKSTHAGIPWLKRLRDEAGERIHFWPFDGWAPAPGKSVVAEVYPSIFRNRYAKDDRTADEQDAYAAARWMADMDARGALARYFAPPLTDLERATAEREGWIFGAM